MEFRQQWFGNVRGDVLSGITVALALIPEAIGFSIVAGVDPIVGLHASIVIAIVIAFVGGRAGMISAATGAMAVLMGSLYRDYGMEYLLAAGVLAGIIQVLLGAFGIGRFITFIPKPVMTGFVNALAIIIFMAQLPQFVGAGPAMYIVVAGTLAIIYILPRFTKAVPAPLVAIVVMSLIAVWLNLDVKTVGEMGELGNTPPMFHIPQIELTWNMFRVILPVSISLALVGLLESLLTATIVDDMTETKSSKNVEARGQGIANIVNGFFGGMAGCAMIGQSVINIKSGGRGRLSTFTAGAFLLILLVLLGDIVSRIPLAALVGVMIMVSIGTFDWSSLYRANKIPLADTIVMLIVVGIVVATDNLSIGVGVGVVLCTLHFGWKIAKLKVTANVGAEDGVKVYEVRGQMFFGTASHFVEHFTPANDPDRVVIDFSHSHIWDHSAASAVSRVKFGYYKLGKQADIRGLNDESRATIEKTGLSAPSGH